MNRQIAGSGRVGRVGRRRLVAPALLAATLSVACEAPFDPFGENAIGPFSMYGYLDLNADIQWIRVTPIRQAGLAGPEPIDAVVTLEHLGTGQVVSLRVPPTERGLPA